MFQEGEQLKFDFENSLVKNLTTGEETKGPAIAQDLVKIVKDGGLLASLDC